MEQFQDIVKVINDGLVLGIGTLNDDTYIIISMLLNVENGISTAKVRLYLKK